MAMLLDMVYDIHDHTFNRMVNADWVSFDPDTMERVYAGNNETYFARIEAVKAGTIGIPDGELSHERFTPTPTTRR